MPKESFMLVSLKEDKAKKLAQVLANPTATKILDYLTKKEATESELSKKLKLPLSTVHYNLKQLTKAKLVVVEEFHYSPKGKEVNHYKLASKYIIIAPEEDESFASKLKSILPISLITVGAAVILKATQFFASGSQGIANTEMAMMKTADVAMESAGAQAAPMAYDAGFETIQHVPWWQSPAIDWVIVGAISVLAVLVIWEYIKYRTTNK